MKDEKIVSRLRDNLPDDRYYALLDICNRFLNGYLSKSLSYQEQLTALLILQEFLKAHHLRDLLPQNGMNFTISNNYQNSEIIGDLFRQVKQKLETPQLMEQLSNQTLSSSWKEKEPAKSMTRIFISHSHSDSEIAEQLVNFLLAALDIKEEDIRCTSVPGHQLAYGTSIEEQIKKDLGRTIGLIALITKDSLRSTWVLFELGSAWAMEKLVVPILGPGLTYDNLPGPLKNYRAVRIEDKNPSSQLTDVVNELAKTLDIQHKKTSKQDVYKERFLKQLTEWESKLQEDDQSSINTRMLKREEENKPIRKGDAYYSKDGEGPFCTGCYDKDQKLIRLKTNLPSFYKELAGNAQCPVCEEYYIV